MVRAQLDEARRTNVQQISYRHPTHACPLGAEKRSPNQQRLRESNWSGRWQALSSAPCDGRKPSHGVFYSSMPSLFQGIRRPAVTSLRDRDAGARSTALDSLDFGDVQKNRTCAAKDALITR